MPVPECAQLEELREYIGDCHRCPLGDSRITLVFGVGDSRARVMLVGEAPGRTEDVTGLPFVGAAGTFLDELLAQARLSRDEVYVTNVVKCRPPGNRNPAPLEVRTCSPFLREQIRLIDPSVIVTLGNFATRAVLETDRSITALRGAVRTLGSRRVLPVFHPAAAIYDRSKRDVLLGDFSLLRELLDESDEAPESESSRGPEGRVGGGHQESIFPAEDIR